MRLIDADTLKGCKIIQPYKGEMKDQAFVRIFEIDDIPTAFDRNKVVQQLENKMQTHKRVIEYEKKNGTVTEEFQERKAVEVLEDAIEIVKGGGVDAD